MEYLIPIFVILQPVSVLSTILLPCINSIVCNQIKSLFNFFKFSPCSDFNWRYKYCSFLSGSLSLCILQLCIIIWKFILVFQNFPSPETSRQSSHLKPYLLSESGHWTQPNFVCPRRTAFP